MIDDIKKAYDNFDTISYLNNYRLEYEKELYNFYVNNFAISTSEDTVNVKNYIKELLNYYITNLDMYKKEYVLSLIYKNDTLRVDTNYYRFWIVCLDKKNIEQHAFPVYEGEPSQDVGSLYDVIGGYHNRKTKTALRKYFFKRKSNKKFLLYCDSLPIHGGYMYCIDNKIYLYDAKLKKEYEYDYYTENICKPK